MSGGMIINWLPTNVNSIFGREVTKLKNEWGSQRKKMSVLFEALAY